ncbi:MULTISPECIES: hypothetical protein [Paraburkholderia]|uniref:hypothetical protein n=1 Tax=Paraburkholderia TaxID=1822464 RepID=UPI00225413F8|nr:MULTISPECIES: hypothetical protein [Paraburkholderia]MCX4155521.1 hypothetical protein [Paraburkholderia aspalathi]MDN7164929.1 hypothetical protein [Paraburkholderia sp. SECH2]MDQ6393415.1 hypothetical protein [Paraburkholderia aspalathi]
MPKIIRANGKLGERKAAGIVAELERWRNGELGTKLTWECVEAFSGFTRQALSRHPEIQQAYLEAKRALAMPARRSRSRVKGDEVLYLDKTIERLRARITQYEALEQQWLQRWQRIAFHCARKGLNIEELDLPLDSASRR